LLPETLINRLDAKWYREYADNWDDELLRRRILSRLQPGHHILDLGAGAGIVRQMDFRNQGVRTFGIDPDPRVLSNPMLDVAKTGVAEHIPFADNSFDLVFADNVLEHLPDPLAVFREVRRVLKPGGEFLFKTPNKWHYMPLVSRLTPHAFHQFYNRLRGREAVDTFPTLYRANSRGDVGRLAKQAGLLVRAIELIEGRPEYLRISPVTYFVGHAYERTVNSGRLLEGLRIVIIGSLYHP
jgi:SAM-dependent methyltransferase